MSTVSKILVIVVLVLVAGSTFLQIAVFAQKANWRTMYEQEKTNGKSAVDGLILKVSEKDAIIGSRNTELENIKASNVTLTAKVEELTAAVRESETRAQRQETLAKEKEDQLTRLQEKVDNMIREIGDLNEKMRRDAQELLEIKRDYERVVNSVTALRDKNNSVMLQLTNARKQLEETKLENEKLSFTLRKYAAAGNKEVVVDTPKKIVRAHVLAANNEAGVVILSVGKDDNVETGFEFIVHRGETYLCKVRVEATYPDTCVARVISNSMAGDNVAINVGDNAFTD